MPDVVRVANVENMEKLKMNIEELFKKEQYAELTQAIGMHSLLIDPQHTISDQTDLYRVVLNMIKDRLRKSKDKDYAAWYADFPKLMDELVFANQIVTDKSSLDVIASRRAAYGPFTSIDDFFFWALNDRRLTLDRIVAYIVKTTEMHKKG